jgi:hypothetical protein
MSKGILLVSTRKYSIFIKPLLRQIDKFFLPKEELTIFLFTDEEFLYDEESFDFEIKQFQIPSYGFPDATIKRYSIFNEYSESMKDCSHLYYLDIDMEIVAPIGNEFLVNGLLAVRHPGMYATNRWGSPNNSKESASWFPEQYRKHYYCGGVQGGKTEHYLEACKILSERIEEDEKKGIIAEWHDETHWNRYTSFDHPELVTEFSPSYCIPGKHKEAWGLSEFESKIIALDKNHADIRS